MTPSNVKKLHPPLSCSSSADHYAAWICSVFGLVWKVFTTVTWLLNGSSFLSSLLLVNLNCITLQHFCFNDPVLSIFSFMIMNAEMTKYWLEYDFPKPVIRALFLLVSRNAQT